MAYSPDVSIRTWELSPSANKTKTHGSLDVQTKLFSHIYLFLVGCQPINKRVLLGKK